MCITPLVFAILIRGIVIAKYDACGTRHIISPYCIGLNGKYVSAEYSPRTYGGSYGDPVWAKPNYEIRAFEVNYQPYATYSTYLLGYDVKYLNESRFYPGLSTRTYNYTSYIEKLKNYIRKYKDNLRSDCLSLDEMVGLAAWILTNQATEYYNYDLYNHVNQRNPDNPWIYMPDTLYGIIEMLKNTREAGTVPLKLSHAHFFDFGPDDPYLGLNSRSLIYESASFSYADVYEGTESKKSVEVVLRNATGQCLIFVNSEFPYISKMGVILRNANPEVICWFLHKEPIITNAGILKAKCFFTPGNEVSNDRYTKMLYGIEGSVPLEVTEDKTCYIFTNTEKLKVYDAVLALGYDDDLYDLLKSVMESPYF